MAEGEQITKNWESIFESLSKYNDKELGRRVREYLGEWSLTSDEFSDEEVLATQKMLLDMAIYMDNMGKRA